MPLVLASRICPPLHQTVVKGESLSEKHQNRAAFSRPYKLQEFRKTVGTGANLSEKLGGIRLTPLIGTMARLHPKLIEKFVGKANAKTKKRINQGT
ncbi:MAG: hypothetical protein NZ805_06495 [Armatimonadetes bacterium]|nr:hypothetical protein [Armatimonadota bacterium]MDW8028959.1 hypothetical protein [Armatimonadota bacterium]